MFCPNSFKKIMKKEFTMKKARCAGFLGKSIITNKITLVKPFFTSPTTSPYTFPGWHLAQQRG